MPYSIYHLIDPRDQQPHYVGITLSMEQRLRAHLQGDPARSEKNEWIRDLQAQGLQPLMSEVEQAATEQEAREREAWWIRELLGQGIPLLNITGARELATEKVTAYFTPPQYDRIEELRQQHRKRTGKRLSVNELLRHLVEQANIEDIVREGK